MLRDLRRGLARPGPPQAAAKGLDLVAQIDPEVPPVVRGDVTRIRQVLVNLLGNAVKFTEHGEVLVTVSREPLDDLAPRTPARSRFAVRDTGIGIPADRMDRLFRSFSQVDASTTRVYGGTGLGLAISRRLAEAMGGTLDVDSESARLHVHPRPSPWRAGRVEDRPRRARRAARPLGARRRRQRHQPHDPRAQLGPGG